MQLQRFEVAVARQGLDLDKALEAGEGTGYDVHRFTLLHPDVLAGEQAGPRYGLGTSIAARGVSYSTLYAWLALTRMGVDVDDFPLWKQRVLSIDKLADPAPDDAGDAAVDPTNPAPGTGWP